MFYNLLILIFVVYAVIAVFFYVMNTEEREEEKKIKNFFLGDSLNRSVMCTCGHIVSVLPERITKCVCGQKYRGVTKY